MKNQNRRQFLKSVSQGAAALSLASPSLVSFLSCSNVNRNINNLAAKNDFIGKNNFGNLTGILPSSVDEFILSDSLNYKILIKAGDTINSAGDTFGWNNDYIAFLPIKPGKSNEGFLWVNHEYPHSLLVSNYDGKSPKTREQVEKEQESCGGSILYVKKNPDGLWDIQKPNKWNKRISGRTWIPFAGNAKISGTTNAYGTTANCAGGFTPWQTFLSCEENFDIFYGDRSKPNGEVKYNKVLFDWYKHYPNPPEHYGWVVEVNPFNGTAKKHTALGRFSHEGATVTLGAKNIPVVYSGDDIADGCVYKFIAEKANSLERGMLYVANLEEKKWIALDYSKNEKLRKVFTSQLEVLTYAREAAKVVGGTPLDRPEDIEIHPINKSIIMALTGNPSKNNNYGSLLKIVEKNNNPLAMEFDYETFLAGGPSTGFSSPDNLEFDQNGNLWFTSDISDTVIGKNEYKPFQNNGLFFVPMSGGKAGQVIQVASAPVEAEITGPKFSPDYKTLFVCVQHPGGQTVSKDNPTSRWPDGGLSLPKPAVLQIYGSVLEEVARRS